MSKRKQVAKGASVIGSTEVGTLLSELLDPRYQAFAKMEASDMDVLEFLEAARQLFESNGHAKKFRRMPIDTLGAAKYFTNALVQKIDEIRQEGNPANDPVQYQRLQLANLIARGLEGVADKVAGKAFLMDWTKRIWAEADKLARVKKSHNGGKRELGPDRTKQIWARPHIASLLKANPGISVSAIARELHAKSQKENRRFWPNANAARSWLKRYPSLRRREKAER